ncbi:CPBP family intramembrane glutamic endopeptidase [uncultured Clostridium sp.]|uniref:CPBP family intramembrane glutamic endopeptidase n=1 Tax=uncultured Clostridium sp. TaxID=59620 RepID=UPI0025F675B4|nr:CPBP family intramembrane glutamic endopeptidase [uncultured Clostridium sp.]
MVIRVIYNNETISIIIKKAVQNFTYIILFIITLTLMKISTISFKKYGLFLSKFYMQMLLGVIVSIIMLIAQLIFFRSIPQIPSQLIYTLISQFIVSISEETFWRGFILENVEEIIKSNNMTVFISALLFALYHYPINHSISQVINAFFLGIVFGVLRTEFKETIGIPTLATAHAIINIF